MVTKSALLFLFLCLVTPTTAAVAKYSDKRVREAPPKPSKRTGTVRFVVTPWAKISVAGKACLSPCTLKLSAGSYTATLRMSSRTIQRSFRVHPGKKLTLHTDMTKERSEGTGTVKFSARPWAKVMVDGEHCTTPCSLTLPSGSYTADFKRAQKVVQRTFSVVANDTTKVHVDMVKLKPERTGKARFDARPWAKVAVEGRQCTTPCTLSLLEGRYTATLKRGTKTIKKSFRVKASQTVHVMGDLR